MAAMRCPGPHRRNVRPDEVQEIDCSECGKTVEVWPDEAQPGQGAPEGEGPAGVCPHCRKEIPGGEGG